MAATKGRPKLKLSEEDIYELASIGCTLEEISHIIGVNRSTIIDRYMEPFNSGTNVMKQSLRRERLKIAMDPTHRNQATMLIFLSKVVLGEKEYSVIDAPKLPSDIGMVDAVNED